MKKTLTDSIDIFNKNITIIVVTEILESKNCYVCNLYDDDGNIVYKHAALNIDEVPFSLHAGEKEYINGLSPKITWLESTIDFWLDFHKIDFVKTSTKATKIKLIPSDMIVK